MNSPRRHAQRPPRSPTKRVLAVLALFAFWQNAAAPLEPVFAVGDRPAQHAIVTAAWADQPAQPVPDSAMLREAMGIVAVLNAREIRDLNRAVQRQTRLDAPPTNSPGGWRLHLVPRSGEPANPRHTIRIRLHSDGWPFAESGSQTARLDSSAFERISLNWLPARPDPAEFAGREHQQSTEPNAITNDPDPQDSEPTTHQLQPVPSSIRLDPTTLAERFARGRRSPFAGVLTRSIESESFMLTLPADPDLSRPMGLLVWINPSPKAEAPQPVLDAAAQHSLAVVIPANAGNDRAVIDRLQLALDAVATAQSTLWIDRERIYTGGMSGGGRLASMLWAGAPDVFTGAVCIVGINSQHRVPVGDGKSWPATHALPTGSLGRAVRTHPIAAVSGARDFNFTESRARIAALHRDGYNARFFDVPELAHAMPPSEALADAIRWIDRVVLERREKSAVAASNLLDQFDLVYRNRNSLTPRERRTLERVTVIAPWTEPAWEAAAALGVTPPIQPRTPATSATP